MTFTARGTPLSSEGLTQVINTLDISQAVLWAVLTVESSGFGFLVDRRPKILFERHIFHRESQSQFSQQYPDISNPQPGGYIGGAAEYARLQRALTLNRDAALKSTSWGIAQIMGFNFASAGFASVEAMVKSMVQSEDCQVMAMTKFIQYNQFDKALRQRDWQAFAHDYNGPDYTRNRYDEKLAAAYANAQTTLPDLTLRSAQAALLYLGFNPGPIDGLLAQQTHSALCAFQSHYHLTPSGQLDEKTQNMIMTFAFSTTEARAAPA